MSAAAFSVFASTAAQAVDLAPKGFFLEVQGAEHETYGISAGLAWPWPLRSQFLGGEITGSTEVFASHVSAQASGLPGVRSGNGRESFSQLGLVPVLRYRFSKGRSPWFAEAGIGLAAFDRRFRTRHIAMGSAVNFHDVLALGRSFGVGGQHELSLRVSHLSNAGLKHPNPGQDFMRLRYSAQF